MLATITRHGPVLTIATHGAVVEIDARGHSLVIDAPSVGLVELGASRAGVAACVGLALDEVGATSGEREAGDAVIECLRTAAEAAPRGCPVDPFAARNVRSTPLAYSARFLDARWLRDDVQRFFPCRVALAHIETDDDDSTVDAAADAVLRLENWRALFSPTGEIGRPLTGTLADFGEAASPSALWGLRRVHLSRRVASALHLEVLGALGRHPRAVELASHMRVVENATEQGLVDAMERIPLAALRLPMTIDKVHALPELLALVDRVPPTTTRLARLVNDALEVAHAVCPLLQKTKLPPIPLPQSPDIRFLASVGEIVEEGRSMQHCVATRARSAVTGAAFFFHVELYGEPVTVQLDAACRVVEARGPCNVDTSAVGLASALLTRWGRAAAATDAKQCEKPSRSSPSMAALHIASALHGIRQRDNLIAMITKATGDVDGVTASAVRRVERSADAAVDGAIRAVDGAVARIGGFFRSRR